MYFFDILPNENLTNILGFLEVDELFRLLFINKKIHQIIRFIFKQRTWIPKAFGSISKNNGTYWLLFKAIPKLSTDDEKLAYEKSLDFYINPRKYYDYNHFKRRITLKNDFPNNSIYINRYDIGLNSFTESIKAHGYQELYPSNLLQNYKKIELMDSYILHDGFLYSLKGYISDIYIRFDHIIICRKTILRLLSCIFLTKLKIEYRISFEDLQLLFSHNFQHLKTLDINIRVLGQKKKVLINGDNLGKLKQLIIKGKRLPLVFLNIFKSLQSFTIDFNLDNKKFLHPDFFPILSHITICNRTIKRNKIWHLFYLPKIYKISFINSKLEYDYNGPIKPNIHFIHKSLSKHYKEFKPISNISLVEMKDIEDVKSFFFVIREIVPSLYIRPFLKQEGSKNKIDYFAWNKDKFLSVNWNNLDVNIFI